MCPPYSISVTPLANEILRVIIPQPKEKVMSASLVEVEMSWWWWGSMAVLVRYPRAGLVGLVAPIAAQLVNGKSFLE